MHVPHSSVQLDAVGGMMTVIGGTFMGVGAVQTAGPRQDVWINPWFDGGSAVVAAGFLLVISAITSEGRSWRWRRAPAARAGAASAGRSSTSPLLLDLGREDWHPFDDVWGFGLAVHIFNRTGDPITIVQCDFLDGSNARQHPPLAEKSRLAVSDWITRISSDHSSELLAGEITVPPHESVTRWLVSSAYALRNGGRPHLTIRIKDTLNNTYELNVLARPAIIYRLRRGIGD
jgi:hypothetical protein